MTVKTKKIAKSSKIKLYISGNQFELYEYEKPYWFNMNPLIVNNDSIQKKDTPDERRYSSIKRSRDKIRRLCNANVGAWGRHKAKFFTYTFEKEITDLKEARFYWEMYIRKVRYMYPNIKYLGVAEIQKKRYETYGVKVWHFHVIFFNYPFVVDLKDKTRDLWKQGFIKVNAIDHVKNYGAYVSKYLRKDLYEKELIGEKSFFTSRGLVQPKRYRKQVNVDKFFTNNNTKVQFIDEYVSNTLGIIKYKTGTICD